MINFDFTDKRILVVGGSRGIGKGVVENLILLGAEVLYAARNPFLEEKNAKFIEVDLNYESQIIDMFSEIDKGGGIDAVVNTAAINYCKKFDEISTDEWDKVERINLRAAFILCKHASIRMKGQKYGKIVNVSSIAGRHRSLVSGVHYVSTKAGLIGLTKQLAYELGPYNVNVNVVCPSQTMSDMLKESMSDNELKVLADNIPLRRISAIDEQVGPILFLCSELSSYMTGAVIDVNGGQI
jgi:NAD(P)-dependent dehydrogenase (short-subunit alcohol dehydrogenase family)